MPGPLLIAGIAAASQLAGGILNAGSQAAQNRKERNFAREMYGRQRADALEDWNRETSYNSPQSQMQRLRQAGLNPNLVYGDTVVQSAPSTRSSSAPGWHPKAPEYGSGLSNAASSLSMYYDLKFREAQTDNVMAATDVAMEDKVLKQAQAYATLVGAGKTDLEARRLMAELPNVQKLSDISVDHARANVDARLKETAVMLRRDEREAALQSPTLKKAAEEILNLRAQRLQTQAHTVNTRQEWHNIIQQEQHIRDQIKNLEKDRELKQLDINLKKQGIQPGDNIGLRVLTQYLNRQKSLMKGSAGSAGKSPSTDSLKEIIRKYQGIY